MKKTRYPSIEELVIKILELNLVKGEKITLICENEYGYKWKDHVYFESSTIYDPEPFGYDFWTRTQNGVAAGIIGLTDWFQKGDERNVAGIGGIWLRDLQRGWT